MQPEVSYILYATSYHEQTGDIITFAQFEESNSVENELNAEEDSLRGKITQKNMNQFCLQLRSYLKSKNLMTDL